MIRWMSCYQRWKFLRLKEYVHFSWKFVSQENSRFYVNVEMDGWSAYWSHEVHLQIFGRRNSLHHVLHLHQFYSLTRALINRFHPSLCMLNKTATLAREFKLRIPDVNVKQARDEAEHLYIRRFSLQYLHSLTIGVYQVNFSPCHHICKIRCTKMRVKFPIIIQTSLNPAFSMYAFIPHFIELHSTSCG